MPSSEDAQKAVAGLWQELRTNRRAWIVLGRNLVPVIGVLAFAWSAGLALFDYWFDGLSAVAAIIAVMLPRAIRESGPIAQAGLPRKLVTGVFVWGVLMVFVALPYWIVLIPLHRVLLDPDLWTLIRQEPSVWVGLLWVAGSNSWTAVRRRYAALPDKEMKQALRWDVYLLILRAMAMFLLAIPAFPLGMLVVMALVMTWLEVFPARALRATFGDPERLWEYDPAEERERRVAARPAKAALVAPAGAPRKRRRNRRG